MRGSDFAMSTACTKIDPNRRSDQSVFSDIG
jgi:hypothetical protein